MIFISSSETYNTLIEIGPGYGATLKYFSEKYNFNKIVGYDLIFLRRFNKKKNTYKNIKLIEGNFNYIQELPVEGDNSD